MMAETTASLQASPDRAAAVAKIAIANDPAAIATQDTLIAALEDPSAFVRVSAIPRLDALCRRQDFKRGVLLPIILKKLDDPDSDVAVRMASLGSSINAFGDGSVRIDLMSLGQPCSAMMLRIAQSEPANRAAVVEESLTTAGESPFLIPAWVGLLSDLDPAVRASAAKGLRRYSDIWHAARRR